MIPFTHDAKCIEYSSRDDESPRRAWHSGAALIEVY
jgi:hypothetical protein